MMAKLEPKDFSNKIREEIEKNKTVFGLDRSIFNLLNIAKGEDYYEMLWHMLRIIKILELKDESLYKTIERIQDNPEEIKKYFYSLIISIMSSIKSEEK
jgi:hypothetical protein